jgi:hypothetical protein
MHVDNIQGRHFIRKNKPTALQPRQGLVSFLIRQFIENPW